MINALIGGGIAVGLFALAWFALMTWFGEGKTTAEWIRWWFK